MNVRVAALAVVAAIGPGLANAAQVPSFQVTGRLAVSEPHSCDGGGSTGDLTVNEGLTWTQCHAFKQHMDAAGNPITANAFDAAALRPLSVTVQIETRCYYNGASASDLYPTASVSVQTDERGEFVATIPATDCPGANPEGVQTIASALLSYAMPTPAGPGTIRAIWDKALGMTVYNSVQSDSEPVLYSYGTNNFVIPRLLLGYYLVPFPLGPTLQLGNQTFFEGASPGFYDYLRGALGAWQTTVRLHQLLSARLASEGAGAMYERMFVTEPPQACDRCYTLAFVTEGGGAGGAGSYAIDRPSQSPAAYASLVSVGLPAHEFGHTMHGGMAPGSFHGYYGYDNTMHVSQTRQGALYGFHMIYTGSYGTLQQQELGEALVEGFADAIARCFLNNCEIDDRHWGNPDPLWAMWNPESFAFCDSFGDCPYGAFRFQMLSRGIAENSPTWKRRFKALGKLAKGADHRGAVVVMTNNEVKVRNFLCDLLDSNADVAFATGQIGGKVYVQDLMWQAAEILDGRSPKLRLATYASDPFPDNVSLPWSRVLTALDEFPVGLLQLAAPLFLSQTITDGANADYNLGRISIEGVLSPQSLGRYLVNRGDLTLADLNSILRANRMDEVP